jgi:hypothetical protein
VFSRCALIVAAVLAATGAAGAEDAPVRDPMQPYRFVAGPGGPSGVVGVPRFALTAVLISPTRRVAIVNGKPYERGESVDGAEIVRIDPDAVHLRQHGNELVVPLGHAAAAGKLSQGETAP